MVRPRPFWSLAMVYGRLTGSCHVFPLCNLKSTIFQEPPMAHDQAYRTAEERIEQARQQDAKKLDLSDLNLTELPESLGQLTQLQYLYLQNNRLTALPKSIAQLTQLLGLLVNNNRLTALPEPIGQ